MLNDIMTQVNNHFIKDVETGQYSIFTKTISGLRNEYLVGQYVWVYNSLLNDDVYKITAVGTGSITVESTDNLTSETGDFTVFGLAVPKDFLRLVAEVTAYKGSEGVSSESIGKYSVSYKDGGGWSEAYRNRLNKYRRLFDEVTRHLGPNYQWQNRSDI